MLTHTTTTKQRKIRMVPNRVLNVHKEMTIAFSFLFSAFRSEKEKEKSASPVV